MLCRSMIIAILILVASLNVSAEVQISTKALAVLKKELVRNFDEATVNHALDLVAHHVKNGGSRKDDEAFLNQVMGTVVDPKVLRETMYRFRTYEFEGLFSPANLYRIQIGEPPLDDERHSYYQKPNVSFVKTDLSSFYRRLDELILDRPYAVTEFSGFSVEGYSKRKFMNDYRNRILEIVSETREKLGENAVTVFLLRGTVDGIGVGYQIIDELKKSGKISNIVVAGITSDGVVKTHIDNIENGLGEIVSSRQDVLLLLKSINYDYQSRTWESKERLYGDSMFVSTLFRLSLGFLPRLKVGAVRLEIMEGGREILKEGLELLLEARWRSHVQNLEIALHIGYEPNQGILDLGVRAARELALLIHEYPRLVPPNVNVMIHDASAHKKNSKSLDAFFATESGRSLLTENARWLPQMKSTLAEEADAYRYRLDSHLRATEAIQSSPNHPAHNSPDSGMYIHESIVTSLRLLEEVDQILVWVRAEIIARAGESSRKCIGLLRSNPVLEVGSGSTQ